MARRSITVEFYERLVVAFRQEGHNYSAASRHADCMRATAEKAWEHGWPKKGFKPIKQVMLDEQMAARSRVLADQAAKQAMKEKEAETARTQAVQARAQEGQMVQLARGASLQALSVSSSLLMGARQLAAQVKIALENEAKKPPTEQMSIGSTLSMLSRVVSISSSINSAAHEAMVMERLHLGKPTDIIGVVDGDMDSITLEDASARIAAAQQALESANRAVKLTLIEGGGGEDMKPAASTK